MRTVADRYEFSRKVKKNRTSPPVTAIAPIAWSHAGTCDQRSGSASSGMSTPHTKTTANRATMKTRSHRSWPAWNGDWRSLSSAGSWRSSQAWAGSAKPRYSARKAQPAGQASVPATPKRSSPRAMKNTRDWTTSVWMSAAVIRRPVYERRRRPAALPGSLSQVPHVGRALASERRQQSIVRSPERPRHSLCDFRAGEICGVVQRRLAVPLGDVPGQASELGHVDERDGHDLEVRPRLGRVRGAQVPFAHLLPQHRADLRPAERGRHQAAVPDRVGDHVRGLGAQLLGRQRLDPHAGVEADDVSHAGPYPHEAAGSWVRKAPPPARPRSSGSVASPSWRARDGRVAGRRRRLPPPRRTG